MTPRGWTLNPDLVQPSPTPDLPRQQSVSLVTKYLLWSKWKRLWLPKAWNLQQHGEKCPEVTLWWFLGFAEVGKSRGDAFPWPGHSGTAAQSLCRCMASVHCKYASRPCLAFTPGDAALCIAAVHCIPASWPCIAPAHCTHAWWWCTRDSLCCVSVHHSPLLHPCRVASVH